MFTWFDYRTVCCFPIHVRYLVYAFTHFFIGVTYSAEQNMVSAVNVVGEFIFHIILMVLLTSDPLSGLRGHFEYSFRWFHVLLCSVYSFESYLGQGIQM